MQENNKKLLRDKAYDRFRELLFNRELKPGQFISQRELSEKLQIPIGPTRDGLKKLESEGLVSLIAQRGIQIRDVDVQFIKDAFQLRTLLEMAAIENFVNNASDEEIQDLREKTVAAQKRIESEIEEKRIDNSSNLDYACDVDKLLHDNFIASFDNKIIENIYRANFDQIMLIRLKARFIPSRSLRVLAEHLSVIEACENRDLPKAKAALKEHLDISFHKAIGI